MKNFSYIFIHHVNYLIHQKKKTPKGKITTHILMKYEEISMAEIYEIEWLLNKF